MGADISAEFDKNLVLLFLGVVERSDNNKQQPSPEMTQFRTRGEFSFVFLWYTPHDASATTTQEQEFRTFTDHAVPAIPKTLHSHKEPTSNESNPQHSRLRVSCTFFMTSSGLGRLATALCRSHSFLVACAVTLILFFQCRRCVCVVDLFRSCVELIRRWEREETGSSRIVV
mmetsp:Transcript_23870/g.55680  ORF Transcript_23870/g.55680 Transcript_23870/m.55680 type:complete len:172 (-) Transcript_23870:429-944(-)